MAGRSIGILTAFINADATQFMKEFNKIDRQLARASASFTKPGAKLALGFIGVQSVLSAVASSVRNVIQNIEKIPSVPAETVASIITLRSNLAAAKGSIDRMTAGIVAFGVKSAQAVGVGFAGLLGHDDTSALGKIESPDEIAADRDPAFHDKIVAAKLKLTEATKASSLAAQTEVQQIVTLRQEAERYEAFAKSSSINTVQRLDAQASAQEKLTQASAKMTALKKQLEDAEKKSGDAFGAVIGASGRQTPDPKLSDLKSSEMDLRRQIAKTRMDGDMNDPETVKKLTALEEQRTKVYERQLPLLQKQGELQREMGAAIAVSFEEAVFSGEKLSDVLRALTGDLLRLMFRNQITGPLANWIGGIDFKKMFGIPAASGGYRDGSKPYLVGEEGTELFMPGRAGTIIPNHALGGGGGGDTFNFSYSVAGGVTRAELMPMLAMNQRATVAAIIDAKRRRSSLGNSL